MPGQRQFQEFTDFEKEQVTERVLPHHILESYHYVHKQRFVDEMRQNGAQVFLDSGAFSAYTLGIELSVKEYCDYIHRNKDIIRVEDGVLMASVLDGIGDPLQTWRNQLEMEYRGVKPLPCFHTNEDERYLEYYVANYEYITLGGMVGAHKSALIKWLDRMWNNYLVDGAGNPKVKVHGFGITTVDIMERYPWQSCDSSTWVQQTSFGQIMSPEWGVVYISEKSPNRHNIGQHYASYSEIERQRIAEEITGYGFCPNRLAETYQSRAAYNLLRFIDVEEKINADNKFFVNQLQELF